MPEEEKSILHFTRIRAKGDASFYDTSADIRAVVPSVAKVAAAVLQDIHADDAELVADFNYIHNCVCIWQLRLAEDPTPCAEQYAAFYKAVSLVNAKAFALWQDAFFTLVFMVTGLFTRRDAKADGAAIRDIFTASVAAMRATQVPDKIYEAFDPRGFAVCEETGERLENLKQLAGLYLSHTGASSWEALAAACDAEFNGGTHTDRESVALALAYPDYSHPTLSVEVTDDDSAR